MAIYYIYIIYILVVSLIFNKNHNQYKAKTFFLWLGLFLIMALRAENVGSDIIGYLNNYESGNYIYSTKTEIGYLYLLTLFENLNVGRQGYIIIISFLISFSFAWFFSKYSKNVALSFFFHLTIGLFAMTLSGIRQSLAISVLLIAIHFAIKRKLFIYLVLTALAILFHISAIIFIPAYFLVNINIKKRRSIVILVLILVFFYFLNNEIFTLVDHFSPDKYASTYLDNEITGMNLLPILFRFSLLLMILLYWKIQNVHVEMISKIDIYFFVLGVVSVALSILSLNLSVIERLSYYYFVPLMVLIPNTLDKYKNNNRSNYNIFIFILLILSIIYFSTSTPGGILKIDEYKFFWST